MNGGVAALRGRERERERRVGNGGDQTYVPGYICILDGSLDYYVNCGNRLGSAQWIDILRRLVVGNAKNYCCIITHCDILQNNETLRVSV